MKILKAVIIICFIGISFSCLRKEKSVVTEINPEIFEHQNIYLSSIGTSIQYSDLIQNTFSKVSSPLILQTLYFLFAFDLKVNYLFTIKMVNTKK